MNSNNQFNGAQLLLAFLGGAAAGAGVALLTSPRAGQQNRERIKELAMESKDVIKSVPKAMKEANEAAKSVLVDAAKDHSHRVS